MQHDALHGSSTQQPLPSHVRCKLPKSPLVKHSRSCGFGSCVAHSESALSRHWSGTRCQLVEAHGHEWRLERDMSDEDEC
eukprot:1605822-Amphidinium_carterae.2